MASSYTYQQLYTGSFCQQLLSASTAYTFSLVNPSSGSSYFTMETVTNASSVYDASSPTNIVGSITSLKNIADVPVTSSYQAGFVLLPGTGSSFVFTPANAVTGSTLILKATGGVTASITP